jgi:hypothetical protein
VSVIGKPSVKIPPPASVTPGLPAGVLFFTCESTSVSGDSGPPNSWPFQIP